MGGWDKCFAVALQPDGKLLLAGESGGNFALARLTPAGALDTTFGAGGRVVTNLGYS